MFSSTILILTMCLAFHEYTLTLASNRMSNSNIVDLGYAKYLGNHTNIWPNAVSYLGLPYAEPPLGHRRFRAPLPLNIARIARESNGKVIDARSYPDFCIQGALSRGSLTSRSISPSWLSFVFCIQLIMVALEAKTA